MTIQEAVKSGYRFRRKTMSKNRWYFVECGYLKFIQEPLGDMGPSTGLVNVFDSEDLLANDWEVEEEEISLTKSKVVKALKGALEKRGLAFQHPDHKHVEEVIAEEFNEFLLQLGFNK